jgi:hypothetical protein
MSAIRSAILLALLGTASTLSAQTGDQLPTLEIESVTVIGRRVVVLPTARKGEVADSTIYDLPPNDSLLHGARLSNLGGTGGVLPGYRELEAPARMAIEGSIGSYFSPRARAHAELIRRGFDLSGTVDYRGTAGHIDSAEASSLLLAATGSLVIEGDAFVPRQRLTAEVERIGDGYFLYGNPVTPYDRSRNALRVGIGIQSEEDRSMNYAFDLNLARTVVEDRLGDSSATASALSPQAAFRLGGIRLIEPLELLFRASYITTSLEYGTSTRSPSHSSISLDGRYDLSPKLSLRGGIIYQAAGSSDSGTTSATMLMPRVAVRYDLDSALSLNAAFTPEVRIPSYRDRIMESPYVDRRIVLRPEKVPLDFTVGARYLVEGITLDAGLFMEQKENTAAVVVDADSSLSYRYFDVSAQGVKASALIERIPGITLLLEGRFGSATESESDRTLPLHSVIDLRGNAHYALSSAIDLSANLRFRSSRPVVTGDTLTAAATRELPAYLLLDLGASYALLPNLDIVAAVTNVTSAAWEIFPGYSAPGLEVRAGARLEF